MNINDFIAILFYFLCVVVSFFAFAWLINFDSKDAELLIFCSLIFPIVWIVFLAVYAWNNISKFTERYLEEVNKDKSA